MAPANNNKVIKTTPKRTIQEPVESTREFILKQRKAAEDLWTKSLHTYREAQRAMGDCDALLSAMKITPTPLAQGPITGEAADAQAIGAEAPGAQAPGAEVADPGPSALPSPTASSDGNVHIASDTNDRIHTQGNNTTAPEPKASPRGPMAVAPAADAATATDIKGNNEDVEMN
ncbi:hypothetical protein N0V92_000249 [Colletotrichum tropicale]|nr:hypothetical protein N0V92_000249 [Colletotrichum tropicale]